ncbi:MAG: DegT/DnrJ/EryC1/StrS family aminotransferase [Deltaproteobacteria bacterium]|nr:DegT/DnrJ/EryC1/StrS family aminotransferase [Deltaproteobacteria bacterium]
MFKIPILDLKAQYRSIREEIRQAIDEILESQLFILGKKVESFEKEMATYLGCQNGIGVASGSDALLLAMMALEIGPGDAVLVPPFTFFSTVSSITRLGATPIFIDIDPGTYLMDPKKTEIFLQERCGPGTDGSELLDAKLRLRIRVILPVHLFGQCCPMDYFMTLAQRYHLRVVEDVAQATGAYASLFGQPRKFAGTFGDLGCFSFFPTKNLGGIGDGGMVVTDQPALGEKIARLRVHGASSRYHHERVGLNSRLDAIQASVLLVKLRQLEQWCRKRIERAQYYQSLFIQTGLIGNEIVSLPVPAEGRTHVFNQYVVRVSRRDELKQYLTAHGIQTEIHYPLPLHLQPCFAYLGHRKGEFPNSELASAQVLSLPIYPELTSAQQEAVVDRIVAFYGRQKA